MSDPFVSIIIVNWNGAAVLERCLEAVFAQTFRDFEVLLVDNASTDNSIETIENYWPDVKIVRLQTNTGFAAANNVGARTAKGQWLALLNNDVFPESGWLDAMLDASKKHPDLYFFTSCQIQANAPDKLDGTGDQYNIGGVAWRRQIDEPVESAIQVIDEVFSACGAAAFYPRDAFLEAGGFDESFFSYLEDVDLGFRLRLSGYRCLYVPQARVLHIGSASLGKESEFAIYHTLRNMVWIFFRNMPSPYFWKYLPVHIGMNLGYSFFYGICCCPCISIRALKDALLGLPLILRQRKKVQANLQVDPDEVVRMIRRPRKMFGNPLGLLVLIPKAFLAFFRSVRRCRKQRQEMGKLQNQVGINKVSI